MSARIPIGFAEAWMKMTIVDDQEAMFCSIGVDLATGVGADQTATNNILNVFQNFFETVCTSGYTIGPGHVIWGQDGGDLRIDGTISTGTGLEVDSLPNNCATLFRKVTALGGRRNRGRMYVPGVPEEEVTGNGTISPAQLTQNQTAADGLLGALTALAELDGAVLLHSSAPFTPTPLTALLCQTKIATQRRRMRP